MDSHSPLQPLGQPLATNSNSLRTATQRANKATCCRQQLEMNIRLVRTVTCPRSALCQGLLHVIDLPWTANCNGQPFAMDSYSSWTGTRYTGRLQWTPTLQRQKLTTEQLMIHSRSRWTTTHNGQPPTKDCNSECTTVT